MTDKKSMYEEEIESINRQFPLSEIENPVPLIFIVELDKFGMETRVSFEKNKNKVLKYYDSRFNKWFNTKR